MPSTSKPALGRREWILGLAGLAAGASHGLPAHAARPSPVSDAEFKATPLARLAARVEPGEFRALETRFPPGVTRYAQLLSGRHRDGKTAPPIDTWTDSAHWDPVRKRTFFQGLRKSNRFISYHALTNTWEEISLEQENAPPTYEKFGHLYGRTALDARRGHFYRLVGSTLHRYLIDEDRWEVFRGGPLSKYVAISWNEALDMVVGTARYQAHGFAEGRWRPLGRTRVMGYHASTKYNPKRRDMLFIGGSRSLQTVDLLTPGGTFRALPDAPFTFSISQDDLTHDPITGNYLVLDHRRVLWELDVDRDEWRAARDMSAAKKDWPFGLGGVVPIPIDELGVIFWSVGSGPILYRHRSAFEPGAKPVTIVPPGLPGR